MWGFAEHLLAEIAVRRGDRNRAVALFQSALAASREIGDHRIATGAQLGFVTVQPEVDRK